MVLIITFTESVGSNCYVLEHTDLQEFSSRLFVFPVIYNMVTNIICVNTILTDLMLAIEEMEVSDFLRVSSS